jgi:hypothetical protein
MEEEEYVADDVEEDEVEAEGEIKETTPPQRQSICHCATCTAHNETPAESEDGVVMIQGFDMNEEIPLATLQDPPFGTSIQWNGPQLARHNFRTAKTNYINGKHYCRLKKACHCEI